MLDIVILFCAVFEYCDLYKINSFILIGFYGTWSSLWWIWDSSCVFSCQVYSILFPSNSLALVLKHGSFTSLYWILWVNKKSSLHWLVGKLMISASELVQGKFQKLFVQSHRILPDSCIFVIFILKRTPRDSMSLFLHNPFSTEFHLANFSQLSLHWIPISVSCWALLVHPCTVIHNMLPAEIRSEFYGSPCLVPFSQWLQT